MANDRTSQDERKLESGNAANSESKDLNIHPAVYIGLWITLSGSVILFNKWVLSAANFNFPLFLTTWHMAFSTAMTQILARFTHILDSRHKVPMTPRTYARAILPIGIMFSLSLICGNLAYLYLSVSFIQMLKATNVVVTLVATWSFGMAPVNFKVLGNVALIVVGIMIASFGEIKFDMFGFLVQIGGIIFEALRLVMVQRLLSSAEFKMDALVSLYYYAPACAFFNGVVTLFTEIPRMTMTDIYTLGISTLIANALVAFLLNVSVVLLIGKTSAVVLTMAGILKDILLVVASILIFGDPVTSQQFLGYGIALVGLAYYKLGAAGINSFISDLRLQLANNSGKSKLIIAAVIAGGFFFFMYAGSGSSPAPVAAPVAAPAP
ncbi:TPT-domain-containing protein [Aspergillus campestris IBT 28561]|uniref:TPT-domain-containing protein n=1 Tax=Aspergillus campestris (strain IBT 28561) TaxID=1392248 RepID=A0A2I1D1I6_ASPC2|nr:TPT-domain-containing protein [Aspergillus campestris IBT 28561]PKY03735.1 TPT-domain-containing protein [Aspergillus campestris IBT 28561]